MAKDPAFLFYSKDWLEGTMEMSAEEKGVYIDLLAHQHQKGSLPAEIKKLSKLAGMSEDDFNKIWVELCSKFIANASGRLVNRRLSGIVSERLDKGWRNTIVGTLGAIVRYGIQNEGKDPRVAEKVKKTFKVDDFLACAKENLSEQVGKWFSKCYDKCYKSIANANEDCIKDGLGVQGERKDDWPTMPGIEQMNLELPDIKAGAALQFIHLAGNQEVTPEHVKKLWSIFKSQNFTGSKFYQSPNDVFSHFINWSKTQKINGTNQQQSGKSNPKTAGVSRLLKNLQDDLSARGTANGTG